MNKDSLTHYRIIDAVSRDVVAVGSAEECAKKLNMERDSFYSFVFRMKDNRKAKYVIETDKPDDFQRWTQRRQYSIVCKKTNTVVASGDATKCAEMLSISVRSFYDVVSRVKKGIDQRYEITIG